MMDLPRDLAVLRADLATARLPRSGARIAAIVVVAAATITAAALAANHYLGQPAPPHVNATFRQLIADPRWPTKPVLRETAKVVAFSTHGVLYAARARDGGECLELVTTGGTSYFVFCGVNTNPDHGVTVITPFPFHGSATDLPPYVVVGRAAPQHRLVAQFANGQRERVPLGLRGYFVFEPHHQTAARRGEMTLIYRDQSGTVTHRSIPPQLVINSTGVPVQTVTGYTASPRARYASFMIVNGSQATTLAGSTPIKQGRFKWTVPPQQADHYVVTVLLVDARFQPISPDQNSSPVPDSNFWKKAALEARP